MKSTDPMTDHRIDMSMLAILYIGFFSCLIRSDYNFVVYLFCYFIWQNRKDELSLKIIIGATVLLLIIDLIFAITAMPVWTSLDPKNEVWQTIRPMHNFGIFCYVLINILKIIILILTIKAHSKVKAQNQP